MWHFAHGKSGRKAQALEGVVPQKVKMKAPPKIDSRESRLRTEGFTLIELLVVISIIAILAGLLLPTLAKAKMKGQGIACMNNNRQIMLAWRLYADDNNDSLAPNDYPYTTAFNTTLRSWVVGNMDVLPDATNSNILADQQYSLLAAYNKSKETYKCPADKSVKNGAPRVRSMSMNSAVGTRWNSTPRGAAVGGGWLPGTYTDPQNTWLTYAKLTGITTPGPSELWVLMDEHPNSINDPLMAVQCGLTGGSATIIDFPASYHNGAAGIAFADGHSEIHKWIDNRTKPPVSNTPLALGVPSANNPDVAWLQRHTSALK